VNPEVTLGRSISRIRLLLSRHNQRELKTALDAGAEIVGVNNRNLRTFEVDPKTTFQLAKMIPKGAVGVAESGIEKGADIARLREAGYQAFLIGEYLMKAGSPGDALRSLLAEAEREASQINVNSQHV